MEPEIDREEILTRNYLSLKEILEDGLKNAGLSGDHYEAKGLLIDVQGHFKGLMLRREEREELYARLQEAFAAVNKKIEEERADFEMEALANYADLKPAVMEASAHAIVAEDMKAAWDQLLKIQNRLKTEKLLREQRDELFSIMRDAFDMLKIRRDEERHQYETEAKMNYTRLKSLVDKGLQQAEDTHEYKETREFLKKIQSEFRGVKMIHEQREELYSRLQTAFDILGKRLDEYFRFKKKNWQVRMQFNLSRYSADIYELQTSLEKDQAYMKELEDQLDIIRSSGKETDALTGIKARIASAHRDIENKRRQLVDLENEKNELGNRLEEPLE